MQDERDPFGGVPNRGEFEETADDVQHDRDFRDRSFGIRNNDFWGDMQSNNHHEGIR